MKLTYRGLFRLPKTCAYGADVIAHRPTKTGKGTLLVTWPEETSWVGAFTVPEVLNTRAILKANVAKQYSSFRDITGGAVGHSDMRLGGMLVNRNRIIWTRAKYYNVDGEDVWPLGVSSTNLANPRAIAAAPNGLIHGHKCSQYLIEVPWKWKNTYGEILLGRTNRPGYGNRELASEGPAIFTMQSLNHNAEQKLFYTIDKPFVYGNKHKWKGANSVMGGLFLDSEIGFIARVGLHPQDFYGEGADVPGIHPACSEDKGFHAPPYRVICISYDANDLTKPPMQFDLSSVFITRCKELGGVTFDRATSTLYAVEKFADDSFSPYDLLPVVHVFHAN